MLWVRNLSLTSSHVYFPEFAVQMNHAAGKLRNMLKKNTLFRKDVNDLVQLTKDWTLIVE